jgi:Protein of unknown function (DUF2806)
MEIKDLAGLSQPLTRLIEVISASVGAVSKPYLMKKTSDAKAYEIRVIANALKEVGEKHSLPVTYKNGEVEVWQKTEEKTLTLETLPEQERSALRVEYQEQKRQQNIESITATAASELSQQERVSEEKPDEDWITRFFSSAQDISSEEMQMLWGRVLAGEIKKPGTYSLKALDLLKNLTKNDAAVLEHVGRLSINAGGTWFLATHDKLWLEQQAKVLAHHHFSVSELGAMYPTDLAIQLFQVPTDTEVYFESGQLLLIVERGDIKSAVVLPIWKFTNVGSELLSLIPSAEDESYLESLGQYFVSMQGKAKLAKIVERFPDGRLRCSSARSIALPPTPAAPNARA